MARHEEGNEAMSTTHTTRSAVTGAGAAALLGIIMVAPALADQAPVGAVESAPTTAVNRPGPPSYNTWGPTVTRQGPPSYNTWGSTSLPRQGPPSYNTWPGLTIRPAAAVVSTKTSGMDIQYAQVALGALGGALLTAVGAAALAATTRGRRAAAHA
jgi:hypothetical protein